MCGYVCTGMYDCLYTCMCVDMFDARMDREQGIDAYACKESTKDIKKNTVYGIRVSDNKLFVHTISWNLFVFIIYIYLEFN
jgi:hypothetical protein